MISKNSKIFIAGHNGLVGNSLYELLKNLNFKNIITANRKQLDLRNNKKVNSFFEKKKPEYLIICAARVGGILENKTYPLEFLLDNLSIQNNLLLASKKYKIKRTIFLGSSCIYPKYSKVPIKEEYFMSGKLEKTNEAYAISKIAGIKLSEILFTNYKKDVICLMPTNIYGENDNFQISSSHVIPGLISKFISAKKNKKKQVVVWGSGKPKREFLYVHDLSLAILKLLFISKSRLDKIFKDELPLINVGSGESISIKRLAYLIKKIIKFNGKIIFDKSIPDGTMNKDLDSSKIFKLKWKPKIKLEEGLKKIIELKLNEKSIKIKK